MEQLHTFIDVNGLIPHVDVIQGREECRGDERYMQKEDDQRRRIDLASKSQHSIKPCKGFVGNAVQEGESFLSAIIALRVYLKGGPHRNRQQTSANAIRPTALGTKA